MQIEPKFGVSGRQVPTYVAASMLKWLEPLRDWHPRTALTATVLKGATEMATHRSTAKRNAWARTRVCVDCGKTESVRKDNPAVRCHPCAGRINNAKAIEVIKARVKYLQCFNCGTDIPDRASQRTKSGERFCSVACRTAFTSIARTCKHCGSSFSVWRSKISGKTNASANFCSRPCYEKWLCRTDRVTGRGSQWRRIRKEAIRRNPFCAICGTRRNLQVHHIVPFRLSFDNSQENLIPLCRKHHRYIETIFCEIEDDIDGDWETAKMILGCSIRERQEATRMVLLALYREKRAS